MKEMKTKYTPGPCKITYSPDRKEALINRGHVDSKTHVERIRSIKVTVCDKCFRACCWQGIFLCEEAYTAGTIEKTIGELKQIKDVDGETPEHPSYYKNSLA